MHFLTAGYTKDSSSSTLPIGKEKIENKGEGGREEGGGGRMEVEREEEQ